MASVCVFCGSQTGSHPDYVAAARQLGQFLCRSGHTLIYGGGSTGIMGALADSMLETDGRIVGVIPRHLARVELMHMAVADMRVTNNMHERKALMHELSDVYIALPGGFGTMEELFEAVTWAQLDLHARPIAVLNLLGIYDGLIHLVDTMKTSGFLSTRCRDILTVKNDTDSLLTWLTEVTGESGSLYK